MASFYALGHGTVRPPQGVFPSALSRARKITIAALGAFCLALGLPAGGSAQAGAGAGQEAPKKRVLTAEVQDDMIIVRIDEATFTCYRYGPGNKLPYFYPVNGPLSGLSLTTESSLPYPHHRSLWFGADRVNGGDYWQEGNDRGQIVSRGPRVVKGGPDAVRIRDVCDWKQPGQAAIVLDTREIVITAPSDSLRIIDFAVTLEARTDVKFERSNHSLFSARVVPALAVTAGGTLVNAEGLSGEKATAGAASPWMDYSGTRFGQIEGLAIFDAPGNLWFPSKWFTRDYGFFSPTNMNWIDDNGVRLKGGEGLTFRYRVVVHAGNAGQAGIADLFSRWKQERTK